MSMYFKKFCEQSNFHVFCKQNLNFSSKPNLFHFQISDETKQKNDNNYL